MHAVEETVAAQGYMNEWRRRQLGKLSHLTSHPGSNLGLLASLYREIADMLDDLSARL